ncbi:cytochrome c oxidase accessory protein CcoG [Zhongshania marina]|uniref:Cytochrome c oxidase accessory protein CcoG n=1 Tax=Zhongshania marina TaxID=2304603 RepID=A0A2S4HCD7_9GAMM|nr:cytochrome c oxidase accessory protein CcoG [Marortus luteolus]POP51351.1 cytochrome c oxidase accessory protein CcoG [Marortus luteolus]
MNVNTPVNESSAPSDNDPNRIPVEEFVPAEVSELDLYQKREKIYTRKIEGYFQRLRTLTGWPLLMGYFLLPWLQWDGRQSVLFDLPARQFNVLGLTFWPQDLTMLAWLLIIAAFALFTVTNFAGRVWCGFSCPQTVWTSIFMWIEQKIEGSRNQRIKLDASPWSANKFAKKFIKHSMWLAVAFYTGFTFVGYFTPIIDLSYGFFTLDIHPWAVFWIAFFTLATYGNAGWLREQVCIYMCPYARFQSAMFDPDTLIISYDQKRGEKRGSRKRNEQSADVGLGDCIDCQLCVQVCPTGIDIRDGLQYQCIGCALCVDACNSVMEKMHYPKDLISYTTENTLAGKPSKILRPRLLGYISAVVIMCGLLTYRIADRDTIELGVLRDRQALYYQQENGDIDNRYTLKVANKTQQSHRYQLSVVAPKELKLIGSIEFQVLSGEVVDIPITLRAEAQQQVRGAFDIEFKAQRLDTDNDIVSHKSRFFSPSE